MSFGLASEYSGFSFEELCSDEIEVVSGGSGTADQMGALASLGVSFATIAGGAATFGGGAASASTAIAAGAAIGGGPILVMVVGIGLICVGTYNLLS